MKVEKETDMDRRRRCDILRRKPDDKDLTDCEYGHTTKIGRRQKWAGDDYGHAIVTRMTDVEYELTIKMDIRQNPH